MSISFFLQNLLQNFLNLCQVIDMDGVSDIEKNSFDLVLSWLDFSDASLNIFFVVTPFKLNIDGENALLVDKLPNYSRVVYHVRFRPILKVKPHKEIIELKFFLLEVQSL
jgi:hypothetical protein